MSNEPIYISFSEEVRRQLAKADLSLEEIGDRVREELAKDNHQSEVVLKSDPTKVGGEDRDIFLLILAGGVAVSLVGSATARVIDAITKQKATHGEVKDLETALDGKGNPIRDASGNPVFNVRTKPATVPSSGKEKTSFGAGKWLKFDFERQ
jgi:hypothetical protein